MKINYKAVYFLLEQYYARFSGLDDLITNHVSKDVFNASVLFAKENEDYNYLAVMVSNKSDYDEKFAFFTSYKPGHYPVILERNKDLTLFEFALLFLKCEIPIHEFKTLIETTCENKRLDNPKRFVEVFMTFVENFGKEITAEK